MNGKTKFTWVIRVAVLSIAAVTWSSGATPADVEQPQGSGNELIINGIGSIGSNVEVQHVWRNLNPAYSTEPNMTLSIASIRLVPNINSVLCPRLVRTQLQDGSKFINARLLLDIGDGVTANPPNPCYATSPEDPLTLLVSVTTGEEGYDAPPGNYPITLAVECYVR